MHLVDGVVSAPVLVAGTTLAVAGTAIGLRRLDTDRLPQAALAGSVFFVASLISVPMGPSSVHLVMSGLAGLLLGWVAFPALAVALALQAVFFGFGGVTALGLNLLIMAGPAVAAGLAGRAALRRGGPSRAPLVGALVGAVSVLGGASLAALVLGLSGDAFVPIAEALVLAHLPVATIEAAITSAAVAFLCRLRPDSVIAHA